MYFHGTLVADARFFPTFAYVFGKSMASIPIAITDALCYGTVIYFFVGLAYDEGASIANYFVFLLILFTISLTTGLFFMIYAASVRVVTIAQAAMSLTAVVFIVFCGFTVQPGAYNLNQYHSRSTQGRPWMPCPPGLSHCFFIFLYQM